LVETQLVQKLQVSRNPIREALQQLQPTVIIIVERRSNSSDAIILTPATAIEPNITVVDPPKTGWGLVVSMAIQNALMKESKGVFKSYIPTTVVIGCLLTGYCGLDRTRSQISCC